MKRYSHTINYFASGVNFMMGKTPWGDLPVDSSKISEGTRLMYIVSFSSIIEGVLKSYLKSKLYESILVKDRLEIQIFDERQEDDSFTITMVDPIEELKKQKGKNDSFIANVLEMKIDEVESLTWGKLKQEFKKLTGKALGDLLNDHRVNLNEEIETIMRYRNLFIHGNVIELEVNADQNLEFKGKAKALAEFLKKHKLEKDNVKPSDHFIELLVTDKVFKCFRNAVYDGYLGLPEWKNSLDTKQLITSISWYH